MAAMPPSDDDRPATRRELFKEREVIEAGARAEFALVRQEMAEGFARVRKEMAEEFAKVRKEMADGLAALRKEMTDGLAALRKEMTDGFAAVRAEMSTKEAVNSLRRELRVLLLVSLTMWGTLAGLIVRGG